MAKVANRGTRFVASIGTTSLTAFLVEVAWDVFNCGHGQSCFGMTSAALSA